MLPKSGLNEGNNKIHIDIEAMKILLQRGKIFSKQHVGVKECMCKFENNKLKIVNR